jgi:hypothetical protein
MYYNRTVYDHPELLSCVERYRTCIESTGYVLKDTEHNVVATEAGSELHDNVRAFLKNVNGKESITDVRVNLRHYLELYGKACLLIRYIGDTPVFVEAHPAHAFTIGTASGSMEVINPKTGQPVSVPRTVRTFTHQTVGGVFQEFGDTSRLRESVKNARIVYLTLPNEMPRWFGWQDSLYGSQLAHEANSQLIKQGGVAASLITVSNANEDSVAEIREAIRFKPRPDQHIVLAAKGDMPSSNSGGPSSVNTASIGHINLKAKTVDELYKSFLDDVKRNVRSCFGLPDVLFGETGATAFASVKAAIEVCEETVFRPQRDWIDSVLNKVLIHPITDSKLTLMSKPLNLLNNEAVVNMLRTLTDSGAITPNTAVGITNELYDLELPPLNVMIDGTQIGDVPFALVKLQQSTRSSGESTSTLKVGDDSSEVDEADEEQVVENVG